MRFSIVVSKKVAAQAVPVVGALGGAALNTLFIDHFQDKGRGHFIIRRLERCYGQEEVRRLYEELWTFVGGGTSMKTRGQPIWVKPTLLTK